MKTILAILIMFLSPLLLFWVPVPGLVGFTAGCVGGYLVGGPVRGTLHALLPSFLIASIVVAVGFYFGIPLVAGVAASVVVILLIWNGALMLFGALVGGFIALIVNRGEIFGVRFGG